MRRRSIAMAVVVPLWLSPAYAQSVAAGTVRAAVDHVTRVETWSFFDPAPGGGDPDYTLVSNRARLGVAVEARPFSFEGSFQYALLLGLPADAVGPGPLGPGALYFAASGTPQSYQLYFKTMSVAVTGQRWTLRAGRMAYESGEGTPFSGRLIGSANWTTFERSFDGVRADYTSPRWLAHASFVMPTQGAFEESASPTIGNVQLATASFRRAGVHLFAHNYRDSRRVQVRPDNTGTLADRADINLQTLGAAVSIRGVNAWAAVQRGDWYGDAHGAFSGSMDLRYEWGDVRWRPTLRGGVLYASGDDDPSDAAHHTFFPMVPTTRPELLAGTYAQMNLRDVFVGASLRPGEVWRVDAEVHHLALANGRDRWYTGTGATASAGEYFGYTARPSTLRTDLGTFVQVLTTAGLSSRWTVTGSVGAVRGGAVVRRQFAGTTLWVMTVQSALSFR